MLGINWRAAATKQLVRSSKVIMRLKKIFSLIVTGIFLTTILILYKHGRQVKQVRVYFLLLMIRDITFITAGGTTKTVGGSQIFTTLFGGITKTKVPISGDHRIIFQEITRCDILTRIINKMFAGMRLFIQILSAPHGSFFRTCEI